MFIDLARAPGFISLDGDADQARRILNALVYDLTSTPWSRGITVVLAGFEQDAVVAAPSKVRCVAGLIDGVDTTEALAHESTTDAEHDHDPGAGAPDTSTDPAPRHVILALPHAPSNHIHERLMRLFATAAGAVTVIYMGRSTTPCWRLVVDNDKLWVSQLQGAVEHEADQVEQFQEQLLWKHGNVDRRAPLPSDQHADHVEAASAANADATATQQLAPLLRNDQPLGSLPQAWRESISQLVTPVLTDQQRDLLWRAPIDIRILGPARVRAPGNVPRPQRDWLAPLVVLAATRPAGFTTRELDALAGGTSREHLLEQLHQWLGYDDNGEPRLQQHDGAWRLGHDVRVDFHLLKALVAEPETENEWVRLATALALIHGELFSIHGHRPPIAESLEEVSREVTALVVTVVRRAANLASSRGDTVNVEWALRRGISLLPRVEGLWRAVLHFLWEHDRRRLAVTVNEMTMALSQGRGQVSLQSETTELLSRLRREPEMWGNPSSPSTQPMWPG